MEVSMDISWLISSTIHDDFFFLTGLFFLYICMDKTWGKKAKPWRNSEVISPNFFWWGFEWIALGKWLDLMDISWEFVGWWQMTMGDDFVGFSAETGFSADFFTISWVFLEGCKLWMFTGDDWVWVPSCHLTRLQNPEFIEFINKHTHTYIYIYIFISHKNWWFLPVARFFEYETSWFCWILILISVGELMWFHFFWGLNSDSCW